MTERLYYQDSYLKDFRARVVEASPDRLKVYLDQTAFYPTSGGQPFDVGELGGIQVTEVVEEDDRIAHILSAPLSSAEVSGEIDWSRRFDHMQQHTGQHLLSAVLIDLFDAATVSFHLGTESCTIDVNKQLETDQIRKAELRANEIVFENRPVSINFQHSSEDLGLRKATEREGIVRIISIHELDRSACGGTHVRSTGEIGPILIRKLDRIRGNQRIEFVCGGRAVARARADYDALSAIARSFSSQVEETPALVQSQLGKLQDSEKSRKRLAMELAQLRGKELYAETAPGPDGLRKVIRNVESLPEELRTEAQSFTAGEKAAFLALGSDPPSILFAASKDSGLNAGALLKEALAKAGGRGGGNAQLAQGSLPSKDALNAVARELLP